MPPGAGTRNSFTDEEEKLLIEYMAKNAPSTTGRKGNNLFKALENDEAYPWHKGHSWQSWRDRYVKNSEYYDHKIKIYQKKNGLLPTTATQDQAQENAANKTTMKKPRHVPIPTPQKATTSATELQKKRKRPSGDDVRVEKRAKIPESKGKEVVRKKPEKVGAFVQKGDNGDVGYLVSTFVTVSQIPRRRGQASTADRRITEIEEGDRGEGSSRGTLANAKSSTRVPNHPPSQVVPSRPGSSLQHNAATAASSSRPTVSTKSVGTGRSSVEKGKSHTTHSGDQSVRFVGQNDDVIHVDEHDREPRTREGGERSRSLSPLFTQPPGRISVSPLPTQRPENSDENGNDHESLFSQSGSNSSLFTPSLENEGGATERNGGDQDDDSEVNHMLTDPVDVEIEGKEEAAPPKNRPSKKISRVPESVSNQTTGNIYPSLASVSLPPQPDRNISNDKPLPGLSKSAGQPATSKHPTSPIAPVASQKTKLKQPPKLVEGPYRSEFAGANSKKRSKDEEEVEEEEDLVPVPPKKKKPLPKPVAGPSTTKPHPFDTPTPTPPRVTRDISLPRHGANSTSPPPVARIAAASSKYNDKAAQQQERHDDPAAETDESVDDDEAGSMISTEVDENERQIHPFDVLSQPVTPQARDIHPFDISQPQSSVRSVRSHVSERDMEKVIKTLEKFISKLDTDRRERLLARAEVQRGDSDDDVEMVEDEQEEEGDKGRPVSKGKEKELRQRGSPLPRQRSDEVLPTDEDMDEEEEEEEDEDEGEEEGEEEQAEQEEEEQEAEVEKPVASSSKKTSPPRPYLKAARSSEERQPGSSGHRASAAKQQFPKKLRQDDLRAAYGASSSARHRVQLQTGPEHLFSSSSTPAAPQSYAGKTQGMGIDKGKAKAQASLFSDSHRRHTIGESQRMVIEDEDVDVPPKVDLRMAVLHARRKSLPSHSSVSSISSRDLDALGSRRHSVLNPQRDRVRLSELDQERLIQMQVSNMARQFGLSEEWVRDVWDQCGDLEATEEVLRELRPQLNDLVLKVKRRRSSSVTGMGSSPPNGLSASGSKRHQRYISPTTSVPPSTRPPRSTASPQRQSSRRRSSPSSRFQPTFVDENELPDSEYSPPTGSRAGKFVRLARQGRREEAIERERRRASAGGLKRAVRAQQSGPVADGE